MTCANCNATVKAYDTLGFPPPAPATVPHKKGVSSSSPPIDGVCCSMTGMLTGAAKRAKDNLSRLIDLTKADDEMWNGPQSPAPPPLGGNKGKQPAASQPVGTTALSLDSSMY